MLTCPHTHTVSSLFSWHICARVSLANPLYTVHIKKEIKRQTRGGVRHAAFHFWVLPDKCVLLLRRNGALCFEMAFQIKDAIAALSCPLFTHSFKHGQGKRCSLLTSMSFSLSLLSHSAGRNVRGGHCAEIWGWIIDTSGASFSMPGTEVWLITRQQGENLSSSPPEMRIKGAPCRSTAAGHVLLIKAGHL